MPEVTPSPVPVSGGMNTSADAATPATTLVSNTAIGPAGESTQRSGLVNTGTPAMGAFPIYGAYRWREWVVFVDSDRKVWAMPEAAPWTRIALSDATAATHLPGINRPVFAEDGLPRLVITGGGAPIQWQGVGLVSPLVTSGTPPAATFIAYLGQRLIANDVSNPTTWFWSNIGDGAHQTWSPLDFDTADASPDNIVAIVANLRELYVFGERSLQVFGVGEDPLNPWDQVVTLSIGCIAPYSVVQADSNLMWLDDRRRIVISDGRSFEDISGDITTTLRTMGTVFDCWSYREDEERTVSYVFVFPTEGRTFVYDWDKKAWTERSLYGAVAPLSFPVASHTYWPALNVNVFGALNASAVYRMDAAVHTDLEGPLVMERVTGWLDHGGIKRKRSVRVRVALRRGTGAAVGTSDQFEVRVADDGGAWGDWEFIPIGLSGDTLQVVDAYMGGVFRRRRYHFRYSGTQETALLSAEENLIPVST